MTTMEKEISDKFYLIADDDIVEVQPSKITGGSVYVHNPLNPEQNIFIGELGDNVFKSAKHLQTALSEVYTGLLDEAQLTKQLLDIASTFKD